MNGYYVYLAKNFSEASLFGMKSAGIGFTHWNRFTKAKKKKNHSLQSDPIWYALETQSIAIQLWLNEV